MDEEYKTIIEEEIKYWVTGSLGEYTLERLTEIIKGDYSLDEARRDVLSFRKKGE